MRNPPLKRLAVIKAECSMKMYKNIEVKMLDHHHSYPTSRSRIPWIFLALDIFLLMVVHTQGSEGSSQGDNPKCPTWYLPTNRTCTTGSCVLCECGSPLNGVIRCEAVDRVRLSIFHCLTHETLKGVTVEGYCPYDNINDINSAFTLQPSNVSELNQFTCGWLNRTGLLCSHCEGDLGVAVLSYKFECARCLGSLQGWALYLFLTLCPLTVFFLVVIFCDVDATAAPMNSILCILQILIYSLNTNPQSFLVTRKPASKFLMLGAWTIVGIWNLDFFRYLYPSFCINPHLSILQVISLEYLSAFYPLFLTMAVYIFLELHDNDCTFIRRTWHSIKGCLIRLKRIRTINMSPKDSIIKYFSTFLLLAYTKLLFVNFNLLTATKVYQSNGEPYLQESLVFYNASVRYLSSEHLPYFIIALTILITFNILPLLVLVLYPLKIFQRFLSLFSFRMLYPLHTFADKFQGCYKDGTNKSRDYRYFAGLYLLIRILYHFHVVFNNTYSIFIVQVITLTSGLLFGIFQPYKNDLYNRLDCGFFLLLTLGQICLATNKHIAKIPISFLYIFAVVPLTYLLFLMLHKMASICFPVSFFRLRKWVTRALFKHHLLFRLSEDSLNEFLITDDHSDSEIIPERLTCDDNDADFLREESCINSSITEPLFTGASRLGSVVNGNRISYSSCETKVAV